MSSQRESWIDQTKSGMRVHDIPRVRMLWIVTMKLIAPASRDREEVEREDPEVHAVPGLVLARAADSTSSPFWLAPPSAKKLSMSIAPPSTKNQ